MVRGPGAGALQQLLKSKANVIAEQTELKPEIHSNRTISLPLIRATNKACAGG